MVGAVSKLKIGLVQMYCEKVAIDENLDCISSYLDDAIGDNWLLSGLAKMANIEIQTKRLQLLALTLAQLDLCLQNPGRLGRELGIAISPDLVDDPARRATGFKTETMSELTTESHPWYTFWLVVIAAERHGVGLAGFKGEPDEHGEVEIGYGIAPAYRNRGYTTEAVKALIAWAFQDPVCQAIRADTLKDNVASNRVLLKVGMKIYHQTDEGLCWKIESRCVSLP